ncbi:MAG: magnesium transporter, partial [Bacteroidales bacterium]
DDITEAIDTESDTDYSQLAAVSDINIDDETENVFTTVKKRFPWLAVLLVFDLVTTSIVAGFEGVLATIPMLALFMPLILNMAGNTGTQSLGVIISLFAMNELNEKKSVLKHLARETLIGLVNGLTVGFLLFWMVIVLHLVKGSSFAEALPFATVISIAIAIALAVSTLSGAIVPLIMKLFKADPAIASGPFITTIDDILSLLVYFGLAIWMLGLLG